MWFVLIAIGALAWMACGPGLAWWMGRRGFDPGSWFAVGLLFGPAAVLLAVLDTRQPIATPPVVLRRPESAPGTLDALVVVDGTSESWDRRQRAIRGLRAGLRRLTVVRVLSGGGPRLDEAEAAAQLCLYGEAFEPKAGLALLFGRTDDAVSRYAVDEGYDVVVHASDERLVATLRRRGLQSVTGDAGQPELSVSDLHAVA